MTLYDISENLGSVQYDATVDLYRQRAIDIAAKEKGLLRYVIDFVGPELMGSIACALDPMSKFQGMLYKAAPVNRTRKILCIEKQRRSYATRGHLVTHQYGNYPKPYDNWIYANPEGKGDLTSQSPIVGYVKDTTKRSRKPDIPFGEFELFKPSFYSSSTSNSAMDTTYVLVNYTPRFTVQYETAERTRFHIGPSHYVVQSSIDSMATSAYNRAISAFAGRGLKLVSETLPSSTRYNLAYQIGELRDLAQTIRGSIAIWKDVERLLGPSAWRKFIAKQPLSDSAYASISHYADALGFGNKVAANAYLTWLFGWQSMYQAVQALVEKPSKITKEINYLISRNSIDTTFRKERSFPLVDAASPPVKYDLVSDETFKRLDTTVKGQCLLRCVINATFRFPPLDEPILRRQLFWRKIGLAPSPSVIYDLIPWTWLLDWFIGLGDYIHIVETIHGDRSLINYGFLTYVEHMQAYNVVNFTRVKQDVQVIDGVKTTSTKTLNFSHSSLYRHKYQLRRSLDHTYGVKIPTSAELSTSQKTILWALLSTKLT